MKTTKKQKIEDIIKRTEYYYVNSGLNSENFPIPDDIETENWKLIEMEKSFSSQEALDRIKSEGCRPANVYELALWSEKHRDEIQKGRYVLAFGQLWRDSDGYLRIPCVSARSSGDFYFSLGHFEYDWSQDDILLCFCDKKSSDTLPLDSNLYSLTLRIEKIEKNLEKIAELFGRLVKELS